MPPQVAPLAGTHGAVPAAEGEKMQSTEDMVGPYALQDFTLYHVLRWGFRPSKIAFLAMHAWADVAAGDWPASVGSSAVRAHQHTADAKEGGRKPANRLTPSAGPEAN